MTRVLFLKAVLRLVLVGFFGGAQIMPSSFHAIRIGEIDRIVVSAIILAGRIEYRHFILVQKSAERVDVVTA